MTTHRTLRNFVRAGWLIVALTPLASCVSHGVFEHQTEMADGTPLHYTDYFESGPRDEAIVLVHGWSSDERVWDAQAEPLSARARVITMDLPGHGESAKWEGAFNFHVFNDAILAVMQDAGVEKAVLVGHSNGAPTVRHFYRSHPERVSGLVIVDGALQQFFDDPAIMERFTAQLSGEGRIEFLETMYENVHPDDLSEAEREALWSMLMDTPEHVQVETFRGTFDGAIWAPDPIDVPLLAVYAESPFWTDAYEEYVYSLAPHAEYVVWTGVHHYLMMNRPDEFNALVIEWMDANGLIEE